MQVFMNSLCSCVILQVVHCFWHVAMCVKEVPQLHSLPLIRHRHRVAKLVY